MDETTFTDAVISNLEADADIQLKRFLIQARHGASSSQTDPQDALGLLDSIAIIGAQAALFGRDEQVQNRR